MALTVLACGDAPHEAADAEQDEAGTAVGDVATHSSLWLADCTAPAGPALTAGPFITHVKDDSLTVNFKTGAPADYRVHLHESDGGCTEQVVFEEGMSAAATRVEQGQVPFTEAGDPVPEYLYRASFDIEPTPHDRTLCYGISFPAKPWAKANRYFCAPDAASGFAGTSLPLPGTDPQEEFSFFVYGDTRFPSGFNMVHLEVAGRMVLEAQADRVAGRKAPSFVVNTGDFAYEGCDDELWNSSFFSPARALLHEMPMLTAPGNHEQYTEDGSDTCDNMPFYFAYFGEPYKKESALPPGMYALDYRNVRFVSLYMWDSKPDNKKGTEGGLGKEECTPEELAQACSDVVTVKHPTLGEPPVCGYRWLQCQLQPDDEAGIDHVFVFHHAPTITAPPKEKHGSSVFQIESLAPLFERPDGQAPGKVTAVLTGHNHLYERSAPLTDLCLEGSAECDRSSGLSCASGETPPDFKFPKVCWREDPSHGVTYLVSGGGGAEPYDSPPGPFPQDWVEAADHAYGYLRITIDGARARLETRGFRADGSTYADQAVLRE